MPQAAQNMTDTSNARKVLHSPHFLCCPWQKTVLNHRKSSPLLSAGFSLTLWKVFHRYMLLWLRSKRAYADQCSGISGKPSDKRSLHLGLAGAETAHTWRIGPLALTKIKQLLLLCKYWRSLTLVLHNVKRIISLLEASSLQGSPSLVHGRGTGDPLRYSGS